MMEIFFETVSFPLQVNTKLCKETKKELKQLDENDVLFFLLKYLTYQPTHVELCFLCVVVSYA